MHHNSFGHVCGYWPILKELESYTSNACCWFTQYQPWFRTQHPPARTLSSREGTHIFTDPEKNVCGGLSRKNMYNAPANMKGNYEYRYSYFRYTVYTSTSAWAGLECGWYNQLGLLISAYHCLCFLNIIDNRLYSDRKLFSFNLPQACLKSHLPSILSAVGQMFTK